MEKLSNKISPENKRSLLVGDFNLYLIKYKQIAGESPFLESLFANNFMSQITFPTWINKKSATFVGNVFLSYIFFYKQKI